jgi:hypothetical protein
MSKWTRTRRDPERTYCDPEEAKKLRRDVRRVKELVAKGLDAEPECVELINELNPGMSVEQRKKLIRQVRAAVYDRQPDLPGRGYSYALPALPPSSLFSQQRLQVRPCSRGAYPSQSCAGAEAVALP